MATRRLTPRDSTMQLRSLNRHSGVYRKMRARSLDSVEERHYSIQIVSLFEIPILRT